jgi:hypothetical protein
MKSIIIEKNTGTNRVIETPVKSFESDDVAKANCAMMNLMNKNKDTAYYIKQVEHNDSEELEVFSDSSTMWLMDDEGNTIDLDIEYNVEQVELPFHEAVAPDVFNTYVIDCIEIYGTDINALGLSDSLLSRIETVSNEILEAKQEEL